MVPPTERNWSPWQLPLRPLRSTGMPELTAAFSRVLLVDLAATLLMTGIIWFVQVVHYPLFAAVGPSAIAQYEVVHATRTGWVVAPIMVAELLASVALLFSAYRPASMSVSAAAAGVALVAIIWVSTFALQVPLHDRLAQAPDAATIARLVATNWLRTVAWTLRSLLVLGWTAGALTGQR